ncbi:MAG: YceI family protein [Paracoccaceae bacterium]
MGGRVLLALALAATPAGAGDWVVDPDASRIAFGFTVMGAPGEGTFERYGGRLSFDPGTPTATASMLFAVETASLDVGNAVAEALARSGPYFDADDHPLATWRLDRLTALGDDRYRAEGTATVKGRTHPLATELRVREVDGRLVATGSLDVDRRDFGIGTGTLSSLAPVGTEVSVEFALVARPASEEEIR